MIYAKEQHQLSTRAVCNSLNLSRSSYYYDKLEVQDNVEVDLLELSLKHKRYGYRKLYQKLRQQNIVVNHKKVYRLYKKHNLALRIKQRKKLKVEKRPLSVPTMPQQVYTLDFVHDRLVNGRKIRILNIIDEFNTLAEAKLRIKIWMDEYNNERPHNRLDGLIPMQYEMRYMENV